MKTQPKVILPKKSKELFSSRIATIHILEKAQDNIYKQLLTELGVDDDTTEANVIFDLAFNDTKHVKKWVKFQ